MFNYPATQPVDVPVIAKTNPNTAQMEMAPKVMNLIAQVTWARPGQPTKRNEQIEAEILERIAGSETMVVVCQG